MDTEIFDDICMRSVAFDDPIRCLFRTQWVRPNTPKRNGAGSDEADEASREDWWNNLEFIDKWQFEFVPLNFKQVTFMSFHLPQTWVVSFGFFLVWFQLYFWDKSKVAWPVWATNYLFSRTGLKGLASQRSKCDPGGWKCIARLSWTMLDADPNGAKQS